MDKLKVFISDDSATVRERLITMALDLPEMDVVGQAQEALEQMPGFTGRGGSHGGKWIERRRATLPGAPTQAEGSLTGIQSSAERGQGRLESDHAFAPWRAVLAQTSDPLIPAEVDLAAD
jgi:hypothetical protein